MPGANGSASSTVTISCTQGGFNRSSRRPQKPGRYRSRRSASVRRKQAGVSTDVILQPVGQKPAMGIARRIRADQQSIRQKPALGYLKPVIRSSTISQHKVRYDERLTIAEDYDFVFRLLMAGASFRTLPQIGYFYRRHSGSVSHRLSSDALQRIADAEAGWAKRWPQAAMQGALRARERSIRRAIAFDRLVQYIKAGQMVAAVRAAMADPAAAFLLYLPAWQFIKRLGRTQREKFRRRASANLHTHASTHRWTNERKLPVPAGYCRLSDGARRRCAPCCSVSGHHGTIAIPEAFR